MNEITAANIAECMSITKQAVMKRAAKESWPFQNGDNRTKRFPISGLPADVQKALVEQTDISPSLIPCLKPEAAIAAAAKDLSAPYIKDSFLASSSFESWTAETAITMDTIRNPKVTRWARILQEADAVPQGWTRTAWVKDVAERNQTTFQTIYKKLKKYDKRGLAGLEHRHANRGKPRKWDTEALDWWVGLCLKREHRKMSKDVLYDYLTKEAESRGWSIGGYESALRWFAKKATPQLLAYQRGGYRALDNTLPPILRSYADLLPFEIIVGDQHRFDFWVVDEETGEVIRPEGYFWQDLRTRCFYGGSLDRKYDAYLIGLALRMGAKVFGAFDSIYTDNGKPELSRYIMGIVKDMRGLGLHARATVDVPCDTPEDPELCNPCMIDPGTHRKAIVRNAKAKMIEGTFNVLEAILRDHFGVPGYVKLLGGSGEENEIDQKEVARLAASGKLLTFWEFARTLFDAMDYYNKEKTHRGVLKEWKWKPKPKAATPMDCLRLCHADGWRPGKVSDDALDLVFLPRETRAVDHGRIKFRGEWYEHEALMPIHRQDRVEIRFDPLAMDKLIVFAQGQFLCVARPADYSSMKDETLSTRKQEQKGRRRKGFILEYKAFTAEVPDVRTYSKTPAIEKAAALVTREERKQLKDRNEVFTQSQDSVERELVRIDQREKAERRPIFGSETDRYTWCIDTQVYGGRDLLPEDVEFMERYEAAMSEGSRERWDYYRETITLAKANGGMK